MAANATASQSRSVDSRPAKPTGIGEEEVNQRLPVGSANDGPSFPPQGRSQEGTSARVELSDGEGMATKGTTTLCSLRQQLTGYSDSSPSRGRPAFLAHEGSRHQSDGNLSQTNGIFANNPLVNINSSYLRDPGGRIRAWYLQLLCLKIECLPFHRLHGSNVDVVVLPPHNRFG